MTAIPTTGRLSRSARSLQTREALLSAAASVFAAKGFSNATLDEVAAAAGLTKGAVYSQFESKQQLFAAAIERRYRERREGFERSLSKSSGAADGLVIAGEDFARSLLADGDWALLFMEAWTESLRDASFRERLAGVTDEFRRELTVFLRAHVERQQLTLTAPVEEIAEMVIAMAHGFGIEHRLYPQHALVDLFLKMIAAFSSGVIAP